MNVLLQKAIDSLHINDVYLRSSAVICADDFDAKYSSTLEGAAIQKMHVIKGSQVFSVEEDGQILRVFFLFGARWVEPTKEADDVKVISLIEAEFVAEYKMATDIDQESIDEFCNKNASYHVWPYWREYLSSLCERLRMPRLIMPIMQLPHHRHDGSDEKA